MQAGNTEVQEQGVYTLKAQFCAGCPPLRKALVHDNGTLAKSTETFNCTRKRGFVAIKPDDTRPGKSLEDGLCMASHSDGAVHDNCVVAKSCKRLKHGSDKDGYVLGH